ncbi:hypothetical protein ACLBWZ_13235 [Brucellaceae bacterium C25G]
MKFQPRKAYEAYIEQLNGSLLKRSKVVLGVIRPCVKENYT